MGIDFENFNTLRVRLTSYLQEVADFWKELDAQDQNFKDGVHHRLLARKVTLENESFRLMLIGEFSRGKSTLINAIFGRSILPQAAVPCTPVVTELKYGTNEYVQLKRVNEGSSNQSMSLDEFRAKLKIGNKESASVFRDLESIEVFVSSDIVKNGIIFVDSPGLNEDAVRSDGATNYLRKYADAILFVLKADQILTQIESSFIANQLGGEYLRNVFFVINYWDTVRSDEISKQEIRDRIEESLVNNLKVKRERIIYVSAKEALTAKLAGRKDEVIQSGLNELEQSVFDFLQNERAISKLVPPKRELLINIANAVNLIENKRIFYKMKMEDFERQYEAQHPALDAVEKQLSRLIASVERSVSACQARIDGDKDIFIENGKKKIKEMAMKVDYSLFDFYRNNNESLNKQISEFVSGPCENDLSIFKKQTDRAISHELERLKTEIEAELRKISSQMGKFDNISFAVSRPVSNQAYGNTTQVRKTAEAVVMGLAQIAIDGAINMLDIIPGLGVFFALTRHAIQVHAQYGKSRASIAESVVNQHTDFMLQNAEAICASARLAFKKFSDELRKGIENEVIPQIHIMRNLLENIKTQKQDVSFKMDAELDRLKLIELRVKWISDDLTSDIFSRVKQ